jgi:LPXTG-motif cell wall-anchored protein
MTHKIVPGRREDTRTITYALEDGVQLLPGVTLPDPVVQTVMYDVNLDAATGEATFVSSTGMFDAVQSPVLPGYATGQEWVAGQQKTDLTDVEDVVVYYHYTNANVSNVALTIPSNLGDQTTTVSGRLGSTVTANVPVIAGYTPDKTTVQATINVDGTATTDEKVVYTANDVTADVTIPSNLGDKVVPNVTGKVGDTVAVPVPTVTGYTADKTTVAATVNAAGTITTDDTVTYTANDVTADVTIPSNLGDKVVSNVTGKVGDTVVVSVPTVAGYTADKTTVAATVNAAGTITTDDTVTYTANDVTADVTIPSNLGDQTVKAVTGKVDDQLTVAVPAIKGYTTDKTVVSATVNADGTITTADTVTYTANQTIEITVYFKDQATGAILNQFVLSGPMGSELINSDLPAVMRAAITLTQNGFTMIDNGTNLPAEFPTANQTYTAYFNDNRASSTVTMNYVDKATGKVINSLTFTGKVGDDFLQTNRDAINDAAQALTDAGYTLVNDEGVVPVTFTEADQTGTLYFNDDRITTTITINYVDNATGKVINSLTFTGKNGDDFLQSQRDEINAAAKTLTDGGFDLVMDKGDVPTGFGETDKTGTLYFNDNRDSSTVTMNYVDKATGKVLNSLTFTGKVGDDFLQTNRDDINDAANALISSGFAVVSGEGFVPVVFTEANQTGTLYFNDNRASSKVIVNYIDHDTGKIIKSLTYDGKVGDDFLQSHRDDLQAASADMETAGYTLMTPSAENPDVGWVPVVFKAESQTGYFYYTANSVTADVTIPSNLGNKVVPNVTGKVNQTVTVNVPTVEGYTPDKNTVQATVNADGTITTTEHVTYTPNEITADVTILSNLGDKVVNNVTGKVGDTVTVNVPAVEGYTPDKNTVQATVNANGTITTTEKVNYTPNEITADVTIPSNLGNKVVSNVTGKVGDTVTVKVPVVEGYTPDKTTVQAIVNANGTITTTEHVNYTPNEVTADVTIPSNLGDKVVHNVTGKVGDTVTVNVPTVEGYTADKNTVQATVNANGTITTTEKVNYTPNEITADVTIPSNLGDKVVSNVTGKVGDTVTVNVPTVEGYTADKNTVQATVNANGTITTNEKVNYTPNEVTADVTIPSNLGDKVVPSVTGKVGDTVTVKVPTIEGYTADKSTVQATVNANGTITTTEKVNYTPNEITADVTIPSNLGNKVVPNVTGKVGDTVTVNVPTVEGYTADKSTVQATVNADGTITTTETVTYQKNATAEPTVPTTKDDANKPGNGGTTTPTTSATADVATPTATTQPVIAAKQVKTTITPTVAAKTPATTLPQTGDQVEGDLTIAGLTILGSIGLLGATQLRKRKNGDSHEI